MHDLSTLTAVDFEPLVGADFQLSETAPGGRSVAVRLVEVLRQKEWPGHRQPFVLHFLGPSHPRCTRACTGCPMPASGSWNA